MINPGNSPKIIKNFFIMTILPIIMTTNVFSTVNPQILFKTAKNAENCNNFRLAIDRYQELIKKYNDSSYAGNSLFRIAVIYDEKLYEPTKAFLKYKKYIQHYKGRKTHRAKIRSNYLSKYINSDQDKYKTYIQILNSYSKGDKSTTIQMMEKFINKNPTLDFLDEAFLWLANEYKGFKRTIKDHRDERGIDRAIEIYKKIIKDFPEKKNRLLALKNLGDCYLLKNNNRLAKECYKEVIKKGGKFGSRLVGQYLSVSGIEIYYQRIIYIVTVLLPILTLGLIIIIPYKSFTMSGLKTGFFHSLFFLPAAIFLTGITFLLTNPAMENINGNEPYLVMIIMILIILIILLNGLVLNAEGKRTINIPAYLATTVLIVICINYYLFYYFDLLYYFERFIF